MIKFLIQESGQLRIQHLIRRKFSAGRISNIGTESVETSRSEAEPEISSPTPSVSITTLPTLPERSLYNRVDQQPEEPLPPRKTTLLIESEESNTCQVPIYSINLTTVPNEPNNKKTSVSIRCKLLKVLLNFTVLPNLYVLSFYRPKLKT